MCTVVGLICNLDGKIWSCRFLTRPEGEETAKYDGRLGDSSSMEELGDCSSPEEPAGGGQWQQPKKCHDMNLDPGPWTLDPVLGWPVQLFRSRNQSETVKGKDRKSYLRPPWDSLPLGEESSCVKVEPTESVFCCLLEGDTNVQGI